MQTDELRGSLESLTSKAMALRVKLEMTADLMGAKEYSSSLERQLEEAQDQTERVHRKIEWVQTEAELNAYGRVADEAKNGKSVSLDC